MAAHCRVCNSTNLDPRVTPSGIHYFHCMDCGANMVTPIYDPLSVVEAYIPDTATALELQEKSSANQ